MQAFFFLCAVLKLQQEEIFIFSLFLFRVLAEDTGVIDLGCGSARLSICQVRPESPSTKAVTDQQLPVSPTRAISIVMTKRDSNSHDISSLRLDSNADNKGLEYELQGALTSDWNGLFWLA
jgi:hypothetical protein